MMIVTVDKKYFADYEFIASVGAVPAVLLYIFLLLLRDFASLHHRAKTESKDDYLPFVDGISQKVRRNEGNANAANE